MVEKLEFFEEKDSVKSIIGILKRLIKQYGILPDGYLLLCQELSKCSPIAIILPSYDPLDYDILHSFLNKKINIFSNYTLAKKMLCSFPIVYKIIKQILSSEKLKFLPTDVNDLMKKLVAKRKVYDQLAVDRAAPRVPLPDGYSGPAAEVYPNYPLHTMENHYTADKQTDEGEDGNCNKYYNESPCFTGGITFIMCNHGIVKGFTCMQCGESPLMIINPLLHRLPTRVEAKQRYLLYDNACKARKMAELRFPHRVRRWTFLVDRKHWENHTDCSAGFNMDSYADLKTVNSQTCEQTNRSLRKLSVVVAYLGWDNYLKVLELFFVSKNLKVNKKFV